VVLATVHVLQKLGLDLLGFLLGFR